MLGRAAASPAPSGSHRHIRFGSDTSEVKCHVELPLTPESLRRHRQLHEGLFCDRCSTLRLLCRTTATEFVVVGHFYVGGVRSLSCNPTACLSAGTHTGCVKRFYSGKYGVGHPASLSVWGENMQENTAPLPPHTHTKQTTSKHSILYD